MICDKKHLNALMNKSCIENCIPKNRLVYVSLFLALLTVAIHTLLDVVSESVVKSALPQIMAESYFSVAFKYNIICTVAFTVFFIIKYEAATFNNINKNKWYLLSAVGVKNDRLIYSRMINTTLQLAIVYITGYIIAIIISTIFKFPFVMGYLINLAIVGLADMLTICWSAMLISLFVRNRGKGALLICCAVGASHILKTVTGYYRLTADRYAMTYIENLFKAGYSLYLPLILVIMTVLIIICAAAARYKSGFCADTGMNAELPVLDYRTEKMIFERKKGSGFTRIAIKVAKSLLVAVMVVSLIANLLVLTMSLTSSTKEFSIAGYIPYIVQSTSMEDEIYKNDLAIFRRVDLSSPLPVGAIVLLEDENNVYIEQITETDGVMYTVDIIKYPDQVTEPIMQRTVTRSHIYGKLFTTNRWAGAALLFANSLIGRILLFILPVILLFFGEKIGRLLKNLLSGKPKSAAV